jgi:membrane-associated phospholipid phosphatase
MFIKNSWIFSALIKPGSLFSLLSKDKDRDIPPSEDFLPSIAYKQAMGKMSYILPMLMLLILMLGLWERSLDRQIFLWINTGIPRALPGGLTAWWDNIMIALTQLGDTHVMLWIILLVNLPWLMSAGRKFSEKLPLYLVVFSIVLVLATVISQSLKWLVVELRPAGVLSPELLHILGKTLTYYSFPSGHTVTAFSGMCILLPIIPVSWRWGALALAAGIGFSRIGVGAHWPIDVASGAFLGIVAGMMGWRIALWLQQKKLAKNSFSNKVYRGLAMLGLFIMATNVAYTPFYDLEYRTIRLALIALGLALTLVFGYYRRGRTE